MHQQLFNASWMTSSPTCSMYVSSSTWMTSSSTQTTWNNTVNMSVRSSDTCTKITYMPAPINATSTPTLWSTSATCYLQLVSQWLITRSRPSKNGPSRAKSRTFSPFLDLQTFIRDSFLTTPILQFHSHIWLERGLLGTSLWNAGNHSKPSKGPLPWPRYVGNELKYSETCRGS